MRIDNLNLAAALQGDRVDPRYRVDISFDWENNDVWHFTTHPDVPTPDPAKTIHGVVTDLSGGSTKLNVREFTSSIGSVNLKLLNANNQVTELFRAKKFTQQSFARKRVQVYMGVAGLDLSEYELIQTQIGQKSTHDGTVFSLACKDVQRLTKTTIFAMRSTELVADIQAPADGKSAMNISVLKGWDGLTHTGMSTTRYGYLEYKSGDNKVFLRYDNFNAATQQFENCIPVFNTRWASVRALNDDGESEQVSITEYQYLEGPAVKILYALLTGIWLGQPGERLPDNWHCGVDTDYVSTSHFVNIGQDLWQLGEDEAGRRCRFRGREDEEAKAFIQEYIQPVIGCFMPILPTGEFGLKRIQPLVPGAAHQVVLDKSVINLAKARKIQINYNEDKIVNQIAAKWAPVDDRFSRGHILVSQDSINQYGERDPLVLEMPGLYGDQYALDTIYDMLDDYVRTFSSEFITCRLPLLPSMNNLEVGDIALVKIDGLDDHAGPASFERPMRVVGFNFNQMTGAVQVDLEGAAATYGLSREGLGYGIDLAWYTKNGTDLEAAFPGAFQRVGNVVTQVQEITLSGAERLYDTQSQGYRSDAVFYLDLGGSGTFNQNAPINISGNVLLKLPGHWYQNADVLGVGGGKPGGDPRRYVGQMKWWSDNAWDHYGFGYWGGPLFEDKKQGIWFYDEAYPKPKSGLVGYMAPSQIAIVMNERDSNTNEFRTELVLSPVRNVPSEDRAKYTELPGLVFDRGDPDSDAYMAQVPQDLCGGGGVCGGNVWARDHDRPEFVSVAALGGKGGSGGAGFMVVHRGHTVGVDAEIVLSGADAPDDYERLSRLYGWPDSPVCDIAAGVGAPGQPGCYYEIVDGANSEHGNLDSYVQCFYGSAVPYGAASIPAQLIRRDDTKEEGWSTDWSWHRAPAGPDSIDMIGLSRYRPSIIDPGYVQGQAGLGFVDTTNYVNTHARLIRLTDPVSAVDTTPAPADAPLGISVSTRQTDTLAGDKVALELSVTPPADDHYHYAIVEIKKGDGGWVEVGRDPEVSHVVLGDGSSYTARARSVSKSGVESADGPTEAFSVVDYGTAAGVPVPTGIQHEILSDGVKISWNNPPNAGVVDGYLHLSTDQNFVPGPANQQGEAIGTGSMYILLAQLNYGQQYYARIRIKDAYGRFSDYASHTFTMPAAPADAGAAAQAAADAQNTANQALTDAGDAQTTADQAIDDAASAQGTANQAVDDASNAQDTANQVQADLPATFFGTSSPSSAIGKEGDFYVQTFTVTIKGVQQEMKSLWQKMIVNSVLAWSVVASSGCNFDDVYGVNRPADNATYNDNEQSASVVGGLLYNGGFTISDVGLQPAGWVAGDPSQSLALFGYADANRSIARLSEVDGETVRLYSAAVPVDPDSSYLIRARVRSSVVRDNSFSIYMVEIDELTGEQRYIALSSNSVVNEDYAVLAASNRSVIAFTDGDLSGEWQVFEGEYTPSAAAKYASVALTILFPAATYLDIDYVRVVKKSEAGADWDSDLKNIPEGLLRADADDFYTVQSLYDSNLYQLFSPYGSAGTYSYYSRVAINSGQPAGRYSFVSTREWAPGSGGPQDHAMIPLSWSAFRIFKCRADVAIASNGTDPVEIFIGSGQRGQNHIGFVFDGSDVYGSVGNAGNTTIVNLGAGASFSGTLMYLFDGSSVTWFIDGVEAGTASTDLPSGDLYVQRYYSLRMDSVGTTLGGSYASVGEWRFLQKN